MYGFEVLSDWKEGSTINWITKINGREYIRKGKFLRFTGFNPEKDSEEKELNHAKITYELTQLSGDETELKVTDDCAGNKEKNKDSKKFWDKTSYLN